MTGVGCLVALAVWCLLAPPGRPGVSRDRRDGQEPALVRGTAVPRGDRAASDRGTPVRVAVTQVAGVLRTGAAPSDAWPRALAVPTTRDGLPVEDELRARLGGDRAAAAAMVAAARLSRDVGAPLGGVLDVVGQALVARQEAEAERDASLAGPRATARVLVWLPALGVLLAVVLGADPWATATDGGAGTAAVGGGLAALLVGRWWSGRLMAAARAAGAES
ncbi:hypothetical protein GCM10023216_12780 [Isoptericola chiayiensis]|uniref:Type II secretion system F domain protein n=1 Tax=Isoptericola chiayiensis TaxID=579446 RepID=A0ABP8YBN0_9MICO|nr:tight adherence protein B [Isoptericola chiayiensis]